MQRAFAHWATGLLGPCGGPTADGAGDPVRCLVRDPRRLGPERVRVQLAIGDLADPASWRNALRGVDTVVHLAGGARDQPRATVEELNGLAAWRLLRAAERAGARHFVWIDAARRHAAPPDADAARQGAGRRGGGGGAAADHDARPLALYAPGDRHLRWLERLGLLPAVPLVGRGIARTQPLWAEDAADCVLAALEQPPDGHARYELAGPEMLTQREVVELVLAAARPPPAAVPVPLAGLRAALRAEEALAGPDRAASPGTRRSCWRWRCSPRAGPRTPRRSASHPRRMADVLG